MFGDWTYTLKDLHIETVKHTRQSKRVFASHLAEWHWEVIFIVLRPTIYNNETRYESCLCCCLQRDHCAKMIPLLFLIRQRVQAHLCKRDILIKLATSIQLPRWDNGGVFMCVWTWHSQGSVDFQWPTYTYYTGPSYTSQYTCHGRTILARACVCVCKITLKRNEILHTHTHIEWLVHTI